MLAHLLYEPLENPQSAKDDLSISIPGLFAGSSGFSLREAVTENPNATFFPNSRYGTLGTALSYFVQTGGEPIDEVSVQLANYAKEYGWLVNVGAHVPGSILVPDCNNTFDMRWDGGFLVPNSTALSFHWPYHTSEMTVDLNAQIIKFTDFLNRCNTDLVVPFADLDKAQERIRDFQGWEPIEIAGIEITQGKVPLLGLKFLERITQRPLFDLVVPTSITVDQNRLTRLITPPPYKSH